MPAPHLFRAKIGIAAGIITNVIKHLMLLFPLKNYAFTAKAAWADLFDVMSYPQVKPPEAYHTGSPVANHP